MELNLQFEQHFIYFLIECINIPIVGKLHVLRGKERKPFEILPTQCHNIVRFCTRRRLHQFAAAT